MYECRYLIFLYVFEVKIYKMIEEVALSNMYDCRYLMFLYVIEVKICKMIEGVA